MLRKTFSGKILFLAVMAVLLVFSTGLTQSANAVEFPLRAKYPLVTPITTEALMNIYNRAVIVDARNAAEYDVIHMSGAKNLLVGKMKEDDLLKVRAKNDTTPLVFYCNGVTCSKSYKASKKAVGWGFKNVKCYDAGIFAWATAHPEKTEFFGKVMDAETLKTSLISKDKFQSALIPPAEFLARSKTGDYTMFDIRDPNERSETKFSLPHMKVMSFDTMIKLINKNSPAVPKSKVLVADNVGKQVRWLQYYFEKYGFKNYYFIKGGVRQWKKEGLGASGQ